jgi:hypothetical protein
LNRGIQLNLTGFDQSVTTKVVIDLASKLMKKGVRGEGAPLLGHARPKPRR